MRTNRTIDWQKKESARAGMRKMVKVFLKNMDIRWKAEKML
nr:type I restriction enzyme endonuclease domain-containing protein [Megasphaera stantonii]